ncbi:hypothetical protein W97_03752 [Coniosporium apollinis CBS 100218]|uniref:Uncharacterized protein n=1 Tax=Coniosporium apollinis (strain CBS 100218) TaxID=1168221 RepID=R7YRS0_CONA1|nr:uncharacterized protein W97_03752 [Coniosporium apollinis CBS 100218]EON64519.1 hypothetical protein W97_03752 [Coniosporium apollinis CBS 100218]
MKAFTTLTTLLLAASTASGSPVPLPGMEGAIEQLRAAGHSERHIEAVLAVRHPCPSYQAPHTNHAEERDMSPSVMGSVLKKRSMDPAKEKSIMDYIQSMMSGKALGKRDVAEADVALVRPKSFRAKRAR